MDQNSVMTPRISEWIIRQTIVSQSFTKTRWLRPQVAAIRTDNPYKNIMIRWPNVVAKKQRSATSFSQTTKAHHGLKWMSYQNLPKGLYVGPRCKNQSKT